MMPGQRLERGKIRGFKPYPVSFMVYLISHETHHRGEIGIILTQSGNSLPKSSDAGMWHWNAR